MARILVVDGDSMVSTLFSREMRSRGWIVDVTDNGPTAVELAVTDRYRLVILDVEPPGRDGLRILREILAARSEQKVFALCGNGDAESGIEALEQGATDYLVRPFSVDELLARVNIRLQGPHSADSVWFVHGSGLTLDLARRRVDTGHGEVRLTQRECVLLAHLLRDPGRVFSRKDLLSEVWGDTVDPASNVVEACVRRLRSKVGVDVIETVRNLGYSMRVS